MVGLWDSRWSSSTSDYDYKCISDFNSTVLPPLIIDFLNIMRNGYYQGHFFRFYFSFTSPQRSITLDFR